MRAPNLVAHAAAATLLAPLALAQPAAPRTLVAVFAHADDEGIVGPVLARYAREGAQVYVVVATDGAQGGAHTDIPRGPELARVRGDELRCASQALGIREPVMLDFPDAKLGDYAADPSLLYRLTQRIADELQRLRPDAIVTFGPDGATGHPDHRLVGDIVTQLVRAGAPGVPERLFYAWIPVEGMQAMSPRGAPPMLVPQAKYLSMRVSVVPADLDAARRAMACHRTQYSAEVVARIVPLQERTWNGAVSLAPAFSTAPGTDLFR